MKCPSLRVQAIFAGVLTLLIIGLSILTSCTPKPAASVVESASGPAEYVGNEACAPCHPTEHEWHQQSRHARTLRIASVESLQKLAPPTGPIADTTYRIQTEKGRIQFASQVASDQKASLDFALGSGKTGMTYVALHPDQTLTELRMSYFPNSKKWHLTPGQQELMDNDIGKVHDANIARRCLGCHVTHLPEKDLRPDPRFFGVGCESCHGPGSAHIAAARNGDQNLKMEKIGTWKATRINELCGQCHRAPDAVGNSGVEITQTQRFQPFGLMQSPCFQKSGDTLSCITCHNPHQNAATDHSVYEPACKSCHEMGKGKVCPVHPQDKCVECHMPTRKVFPVSSIPIAMADHLIWAYGKKANKQVHPATSKAVSGVGGP